jgi:hypothetical protein
MKPFQDGPLHKISSGLKAASIQVSNANWGNRPLTIAWLPGSYPGTAFWDMKDRLWPVARPFGNYLAGPGKRA